MVVAGLIGVVLGLALSASAAAAATPTIGETGEVATYTGTADADGVGVEPAANGLGMEVWTVLPASPSGAVLALPNCTQSPGGMAAQCDLVSRLDLNGNGGSDNLSYAYLDGDTARLTIHGGAGDDVLRLSFIGFTPQPGSGPGDVFGDAGSDTVYLSVTSGNAGTASLDDKPNDGPRTEPNLNIRSDVENLVGSDLEDTLAGSAGPNRIDGAGGADAIRGGAGSDTLIGGPGDDQIDAVDGVRDTVHCGDGNDTVDADAVDTVDECERVLLPPPPPATGGTAPPATPAPAVGTPAPAGEKPRRITSPIDNFWTGNHVDMMVVRGIPRHGRVRLSCSKPGCPFRHAKGKVRRGRARLTPLFRDKPIPIGAVLEVRITAPRRIGKVVRWRVRSASQVPRPVKLCLPPGKARPRRHCTA